MKRQGPRQSNVARKHENPPTPLPACQRHVGHAAYMLAVPGNGGQVIKGESEVPPLEKGESEVPPLEKGG